jgi:hypothetical protein
MAAADVRNLPGKPATAKSSNQVIWALVLKRSWSWSWSSSCGRQSVGQFDFVSGSPLGPMTRFYIFSFRLTISLLFFLGRRLWREDGSVTYSTIADWSGYWGPITIHYRLIWDCVPFLSQGLQWRYSTLPPHGVQFVLLSGSPWTTSWRGRFSVVI